MKKVVLLTLSIFLISACSEPQIDEAKESVLQKTWEKLADKNAEYNTGEINFETNAKLKLDETDLKVTANGNVLFDSTDAKNLISAVQLDANAKGSLDGQKGEISVKGEFKNLSKTLYFFLDKLSIKTDDPQASFMATLIEGAFKGQWFFVPVPENQLLPEEEESLISPGNFKGEEVAKVAKEHNFFEIKEEKGYRNYLLSISAEKLKDYLMAVSKVNGSEVLPEDLQALDELLSSTDYSLRVTINNEYEITSLEASLNAQDPESTQKVEVTFSASFEEQSSDGQISVKTEGESNGTFTLDFETQHQLGKSVSIVAPEGAQEFNPAEMFGLGGGTNDLENVEDSGMTEEEYNSMMEEMGS